MRQFEVRWANLPSPAGRRPVLLLSRTPAYEYLSRVLIAEITTTVRGIPQEVVLGKREGLPRSCVANLDAVRSIDRSSIGDFLGVLDHARQGQVKRALGYALNWPELKTIR
ncbi:MAG TPA: type II toxin-antitoxin system PemK/MazF family toxin [Candidatus Polarisedimenticolaceae bacterium]|nr:type II toxin-antitoxin system PemK/MazF family toxin [Candidatus Polarisedimenticolaceae bacterium]